MAFCKKCGTEMNPNSEICPMCGFSNDPVTPAAPAKQQGNFGWGLLGCCIPLVGLILFLVWKDEKPGDSKAAGIGALVGVGVSVLFYILYFVLIGVAAGMGAFYY